MNKLSSIFFLLIICISHINILDVVSGITHISKEIKAKHLNTDFGDSEQEKENKGEEKIAEEKFFPYHLNITGFQYNLSGKDRFICYTTRLNIHPFPEGDLQPPKAA
ncbi:MAG: hypothetical protein WKF88_11715 [Ferruginibacter sp.]